MNVDEEPLTPELMLAFYRRLYPFRSIFHWLNHEHTPTKLFMNREFAFTLPGDVYLRYQSFTTAEDLKKQVCTMNPTRFEIGPMYTARVRTCALRRAETTYIRILCSRETRSLRGQARSSPCCASSSLIST